MSFYFQQSYPSTDIEMGKNKHCKNLEIPEVTSSMPFVSLNGFAISQATESQQKIVWS